MKKVAIAIVAIFIILSLSFSAQAGNKKERLGLLETQVELIAEIIFELTNTPHEELNAGLLDTVGRATARIILLQQAIHCLKTGECPDIAE